MDRQTKDPAAGELNPLCFIIMNKKIKEDLKLLGKIYGCIAIALVAIIAIIFLIILYVRIDTVLHSVRITKSFASPPETTKIYSSKGFEYDSPGCFLGYYVSLNGSDLSANDLFRTYQNHFESMDWYVSSSERPVINDNGDISYDVYWLDVSGPDGYRIEFRHCYDFDSCSRVDPDYSDKSIIEMNMNDYLTTYWILVTYKPEFIRLNLCDCCSIH